MTFAMTRIVKAAAFSFCLVVVGLAAVSLLAGASARATCADCPSPVRESAGITAAWKCDRSRAVSCPDTQRSAAARPKMHTGRNQPDCDARCSPEQVFPHRLCPKLLDDPEG